ncbi:tyrosine-type recombinase/integrase [Nitrospira sp. Kam-Ns4a]
MARKLTKRVIEQTLCPATGQIFLRDTELKGFAVRLTPSAKTFVLEKRVRGRVRRITLGRYGVLTVEQARAEAIKKAAEIVTGGDPAAARRAARAAPTWQDLEDRYRTEWLPRKRSARNDKSLLDNKLAGWRTKPLAAITRAEVAAMHASIGKTRPYQANRLLALVRKMFNLAEVWGLYPGPNPCKGIPPFPEEKRDRFVTPAELPRLWRAIQEEPNVFVRAAFFLCLLTGARRGEVLAMKWEELDFEQSVWRIPQTKANRPHYVPLPRPVLEELKKLPRLSGNPYVFPGRYGRGHLVKVSKPWQEIRRKAKLEDVRIHDLRRTLGSWLAASGASLPLIGKALNHSQPSTTAIYARLQLDSVREALELNAAKMLAVIGAARPGEAPGEVLDSAEVPVEAVATNAQ